MINLYFVDTITSSILDISAPKTEQEFLSIVNKYEKLTDYDILIGDKLINDLAIKDICLALFIDPKHEDKQGDLLNIRAGIYNKIKNGSYWSEEKILEKA